MGLESILKLGDPRLHEISKPVSRKEVDVLKPYIAELHDLVLKFRKKYGTGRAIAAPQIGLMKRIICFNVEKRVTMINPVLFNFSEETLLLWDDCMCFPNLLVQVRRHKSCTISFKDENWDDHTWDLKDDLSELFQHEFDHLEGILATQRAVDDKSFKLIT